MGHSAAAPVQKPFHFILCTALEDRTLQTELAGYADYVPQVRWRLLPGVW
jgi:hypothetical protein